MPPPTNPSARHHADLVSEWSARFRAVARPALHGTPVTDPHADEPARRAFIANFADELGHRRRLDAPFLHALLGLHPASDPPDPHRLDLDDRLWWAVHRPDLPIAPTGETTGPLDPDLAQIAIEARTETELAAMHALFRLGLDRNNPALTDRALAAAAWQVAELQPDNGTNHPWAAHVFVALAIRRGDDTAQDALLHAQTLVHNCQVNLGRADRLSACILWDAADTLERAAQSL